MVVPYDERNENTNRFTATYSDSEFIGAVSDLEIAGTREVSDRVGCTIENARVRLDRLAENGQLEKREIGGRNVYRLPT